MEDIEIRFCKPTGGKAGKGFNKTSTIQVFNLTKSCIIKQFKYTVGDGLSKAIAKVKAKRLAEKILNNPMIKQEKV